MPEWGAVVEVVPVVAGEEEDLVVGERKLSR
jgi:hypothetical protein